MIRVENLTQRYGRLTAVDDLSFTVGQGEIVGFLGPNGAGKTTTMRVLSGYLPDIRTSLAIYYLPESVPLYTDMRVREYLRYRGSLKGLRGRRLRERVADATASCGLEDVRGRIIGKLSKGFRQRVGLADSLLHEPPLLILDEPTIGLDPNQIRHIRALIKSLAQRHTVLLSSHILPEVEALCQRVLIIDKGKIVASDTTANLVSRRKGHAEVVAEVRGPAEAVLAAMRSVPGVTAVSLQTEGEWHRLTIDGDDERDVRPDVYRAVSAGGWVLRELRIEKRNLEDAFVAATSGEKQAQKPGTAEGTAAGPGDTA